MTLPVEVATQNISSEKEARLVAHFVAKIKETFGPPPIVTGENPEDFDRILAELVRARCPDDSYKWMSGTLPSRYGTTSATIAQASWC